MLLDSSSLLNLSGSTVLLADDNDDLRRYIAGALAKAFKVVQVSNGQDALDYALRSPPALIVSDVQMPRLDGPGLLRALRSNPTTALIPSEYLPHLITSGSLLLGVTRLVTASQSSPDRSS